MGGKEGVILKNKEGRGGEVFQRGGQRFVKIGFGGNGR